MHLCITQLFSKVTLIDSLFLNSKSVKLSLLFRNIQSQYHHYFSQKVIHFWTQASILFQVSLHQLILCFLLLKVFYRITRLSIHHIGTVPTLPVRCRNSRTFQSICSASNVPRPLEYSISKKTQSMFTKKKTILRNQIRTIQNTYISTYQTETRQAKRDHRYAGKTKHAT